VTEFSKTARQRFPVCERYAYFNAGTFGPLSRQTLDAMAEVRAGEAEHGRAGAAYFEELLASRERVRALIAEQVGADAERIALTDSTTQGIHVAVIGLGLGDGDEVVTTDAEHFGLIGPLAASGVTLRVAPVNGIPAADVFDVVRAAVTPRTRLLALSAVSWVDGTVFPWRELRDATGLPVLVDGAQAAGAIAVDATAADWYTISAQKWLCGPEATGALYIRDPAALPPRLVGYLAAQSYDLKAATWEPKPGAARFDMGFTPASTTAGLEAALADLPSGRFQRSSELADSLHTKLADLGQEVVTQRGQATLVSWRPAGDSTEIVRALYDAGVLLRELPGTGLIRASVGWWNDESDLERLIAVLTSIGR
jgi:L-cysteine/cystine lyase